MSDIETENHRLRIELRALLQALDAAGKASLLAAGDALLRSIVEAAARIFQAAAASILLLDEEAGMLEFRVSTGAADRELVGLRFPANQGIAGYVLMTGQPLAVSNVEQDTRFNRDFARSTGYLPRSILAMPLLSGERTLGVMEVLDKVDAPAFGLQDMEVMALFARQAAAAIEIALQTEQMGAALAAGLRRLANEAGIGPEGEIYATLEEVTGTGPGDSLLRLADLLNEFSRLGEDERAMALRMLEAVADYSRSRRQLSRGAARR